MNLNSTNNNSSNSLAIIMCTKNGELFIDEQLNSIKNQKYKNFDLYITDNSSSDETKDKINLFIRNNPNYNIFLSDGNDKHFANNFIESAKNIKKRYSYYAFCDQDDIWEDFHLMRCIETLRKKNTEKTPALLCSSTILINSCGDVIGSSKVFRKPTSFENAIVQSIAGGNTMVFNYNAYTLLRNVDTDKKSIPSHDWLLYLLVTSHSGKVKYQDKPSVRYRQHSKNAIGSNKGFMALLLRARMAYNGQWKNWIELNNNILLQCPDLSNDAFQKINSFKKMRVNKSIIKRLVMLKRLRIYRQSFFGNISLFVSVIFKKI
jgi:glycosyltransferase involved in cell wall biosynthesis